MSKSQTTVTNINAKLQDRYESYTNGLINEAEYLSHCKLIIQDSINDYRNDLEYQMNDLSDRLEQLNWFED
jgi:hypothetical protein